VDVDIPRERLVVINLSGERRAVPGGEVVLATARDVLGPDGSLAAHAGVVIAPA